MNKITIIFIALISNIYFINAQKNVVDSLEKEIRLYTKEDTIKVILLNETAYKLYQIDINKTLEYAEQASKLADKLKFTKGKSESLRLIGIYNILRGNYSAALDYFQKSLKIAIKINDKLQISKSYNNIGLVYDFYEDSQKELEYYKKSLKISEELDDKNGISISNANIGLIYMDTGEYNKSLNYLWKSYNIDKELKNKAGISRVFDNIGTVYYLQKDFNNALDYYNKSLKICREIGAISTEAEVCKDISNLYFDKKNFKQSYNFSKKAYLLALKIKETKLLKESAKVHANSCAKLGLYKQAYNFQVIFKNMNDSLYNEENTRKIASIEFQYKYEKEKNELAAEQQKKDIQRIANEKEQKIIRNSFIAGFILMLLLVLVVYISFLNKRKANRILSIQKNEIQEINNELTQSLETVNLQKKEIEKNHNNIQDSINYASRIQQALLPAESFFSQNFNSHFVLYKPKDIVSGDFYYLKKVDNYIIIAVADCTGHGVPGAFVSMLGIAFLNEIVRKKEVTSASLILEHLRTQVKGTLHGGDSKDGMDIALCLIDIRTNKLQFAGANNPLYILRNTELIEIKGTPNPIGTYYTDESDFINNDIKLKKNDSIYMFSDGYIDQFGGLKDKKFMLSRFQKLLTTIQHKTLEDQKNILNNSIEKWKGGNTQTDDILVIGVKI